ncbi:MAG: CDP-alcohol phosphatidyltransferase family protein [Bacteroidetes bacterium]|nr:CDP-alcohol phosphatidyltransferase family protein [Bacteroidota bacterium]
MKISFKEINTLANYISLLRVLLAIPIFILLDHINESYDYRLILGFICLVVVATDLLDGYFARKYNSVTEVGKIIDPFADKLCMGIIVVKLYLIGEIPGYFFWIVIFRDLIIFIGGIIVSKIINKVLPSNMLGKITAFFIGVFVLADILGVREFESIYYSLMYFCIMLCFASLIGYGIRGYETIKYYKNGTI